MQGGYTITIHKADGTSLVKEVKPAEGDGHSRARCPGIFSRLGFCQRDVALFDSAHSYPAED